MFPKIAALTVIFGLVAIPPTVRAAVYNVTVGEPGKLTYSPEYVNASVGDTIVFTFSTPGTNHTVTQSSFATPCEALAGGFDTGFVPVSTGSTGPFSVAQFTVQDTTPVWVYCRQEGHCQKGMVFAVNPGSKFAAFQDAATGNTTDSAAIASSTASASSAATATSTTTSASASASATESISSDHLIIVGGSSGQLTYSPSNITAQPGDTVTFQFHQKNHTVTQSSFAEPCRELAETSTTGQVGFSSGFMPVDANATSFPSYTIQINDTNPIWVYCQQVGHCGKGMVFSVNAPTTGNTFAAFQSAAISLNGTSSSSNTTNTTGSTTTSGAISMMHSSEQARWTGAMLGAVVAVAALFL